MKTNKILLLFIVFIICISQYSCVEDGNFDIPQKKEDQENYSLILLKDSIDDNLIELKSISDLKSLYITGSLPVKITSNIVVKGYVVSSDKEGNYFKEFYMQDQAVNPTAGIKVALNLNKIYNKYNFGREVYIRLKNLYLGETNFGDGITTIGGKIKLTDNKEIESIAINKEKNHLYRSEITEIIVPKVITMVAVNNAANIGMFVKIKDVFFSGYTKGKSYTDPTEDFDTKRKIETCQGLGLVGSFLETSSFSSFANNSLPEGGGELSAVISKDFSGDFFVLVLNDILDVNMNDDRCTPLSISDFSTILLDEDFENTSGRISISGWTNYIEKGTKSWRSYIDANSNSRAARIGSFLSRNDSTISWLITKSINLETTNQEFLSFETSSSFFDNSNLEVLISTNWDGKETNITNATWETLPARIVNESDNHENFVNSTFIDLSKYKGNAYIAFKYIGSGNEHYDGTYELDNIIIRAK